MRTAALPLAITLLVAAAALFGPSALADPRTGSPADARLDVGWDYVALAPITNLLDNLSILTLGQHYAVLATLALLFLLWRMLRPRTRLGTARRAAVETAAAALALLALLAFYAYGILGPRPMAALVPAHPATLVLDVHSHTERSHDGRDGFGPEDNREWHAAAGFDAVYVSDHRTWAGYLEGAAGNPARAGEGTVLLPAVEAKFEGKYASALGPPARYRSALRENELIGDSLWAAYRRTGDRPTLVMTIPEELDGVRPATADGIGFVALELTDASPRGLRQSRRDRSLLVRMVDSLDLAPVAASNNHGWGRTAAAWTLMPLPGWRSLTPAELGAAIEARLHGERAGASRVVERRNPWIGESPIALATTVPAMLWTMFGGIGLAERISWLVWVWGLTALWVLSRVARPPSARDRSGAGAVGSPSASEAG